MPEKPSASLPPAPASVTPRFSARVPWHLPENTLSRALAARRRAGAEILDLTVSNPTRALPELYAGAAGQALLAALTDERALRYEPTPQGDRAARDAIAAYYAARGLQVDPEALVLCASTSEAYTWLFELLCAPGDRVLFPQPSYPLLSLLAGLTGVHVDPYPLHYEPGPGGRWSLDLVALREAITPQTRAVVVVSPNNPTGSRVHARELAELLELCRAHGLALIADEVFSDYPLDAPSPLFADDPGVASLAGIASPPALCFVLSGLSKVVGLPQLKLGWVAARGPEPLRSEAQDRLELIADTFLSVGTPVQLATPRLLAEQPRIHAGIAARTAGNLAALRAQLAGTACQVLPVEGGWYAVVRLPYLRSDEEWALCLLTECGVLVQPGYFYDFADEAYAILSLLPPPAVFTEGVRRLAARVAVDL